MRRAVTIAAVVLTAGVAHGRPDPAAADEKFKLGKRLLAQKHYPEACQAFEDSNKLDPGIGAELNIGHCYEEWGKLATAYRAYAAAAAMAESAKDARLPKIQQRMEDLDPQVPRLTLALGKHAATDGLVITLDGEPVALAALGTELRVDPGPHKLEYGLAAGPKRTKTIPLERGGSSDITLEVPRTDVATDAHPDGHPDGDAHGHDRGDDEDVPPPRVGHGRKVAAGVAIGVGGAAIGVAAVLTVSARSSYRDALDAHCGGSTTMCDAAGLSATHDARHEANIASIVFGVGAAAAVAGVVLYVTAPHARAREAEATRVVPVASPDGAGVLVFGRF